VNPPDAVESGVKRGRSYLARVRDVYDDVALEPEEITPVGDEDVVVIARLTGTARGSGVEIDTRQGYVWTVRDGTAVRLRWFREPDEAWRAVEPR
jgi:ketosteroid isomerase-like protein